jgi:hypothetical protein
MLPAMGAPARIGLTIALLCLAGCEAGADRPSVGTPGLEPPNMRGDAGGPIAEPGMGTSGGAGTGFTPDDSGNPAAGAGGAPIPVGGAGGAQTPDIDADAGTDLGPGAELFSGLWVIDQPSHALYEATLYELGDDGLIGVHDTMLLGAEPWPDYVTGSVENTERSLRCVFEGRWLSLGPRVIELEARCTDAAIRPVQIELPEDQEPAIGISAVVLSVGGESGWDHRDWPWSWRKCASRDACPPF